MVQPVEALNAFEITFDGRLSTNRKENQTLISCTEFLTDPAWAVKAALPAFPRPTG